MRNKRGEGYIIPCVLVIILCVVLSVLVMFANAIHTAKLVKRNSITVLDSYVTANAVEIFNSIKQGNDYRIRFQPVREIRSHFRLNNEYTPEPDGITFQLSGEPVALKTSWQPGNAKEITAGGKTIRVRAKSKEVLFIADHGMIEYWADDGLIYGAVEVDEDILFHQISLKSGVSKVEMLTCRNIH